MSTKYIASNWRLPNQENSSKSDNYGLTFDGSEYIDCGNAASLQITNDITIVGWFKISSSSLLYYNLITKWDTSSNRAWSVYMTNSTGKLHWYASHNGTGTTQTVSATNLKDGNWHFFAAVKEGATQKLYIDNLSPVEDSVTSGIYNSSANVNIGRNAGNNGYNWDGSISEVSVFDYALSSTQISTLYGSSSLGSGNPMALKPQPVAYYPLGDNSSGNPLTQPNEAVEDASVFNFDGSSDFIDCGSFSALNSATSVTVSAWFKSSTYSNYGRVISNNHIEIYQSLSAYSNTQGRFYYRLRGDYGNQFALLGGTSASGVGNLVDGNWHHLCVTFDNSTTTAVVYEDGVPVITNTSVSGTLNSASSNLYIGSSSASGQFIDGLLSNAQIWNTALSSSEVTTLYNSGVPLLTGTQPQEANLKAWYKLDQSANWDVSGSGNWTIPDASGNGNDGTSSGMTSANLVLSDLTRAVPYDSYSFNFDSASNDYIDCGNAFTETGAFTISAWINTSTTSASAVLFKNGVFHFGKDTWYNGGTGSAPYLSITDSNGLTKTFRNGVAASGTTVTVGTFIDLKDGNWHNITFTYNGTNQGKYYTDGNLTYTYDITDASWAGTLASNSNNLFIGATTVASWTGKISNCSIFNEALTPTEVLKLYSNGVPQDLTNFTPSPVAWWPLGSNSFWNGSQWTVRDMSTGGSNDGTGQNIGVDGLVGDSPRSSANGTGTNMDIESNITGSTKWSENNSWSINMSETARVEDTP